MRADPLQCPATPVDLGNRLRGTLWGLFIGDALAMPVHWYYDRRQLLADFGRITSYQVCRDGRDGKGLHSEIGTLVGCEGICWWGKWK